MGSHYSVMLNETIDLLSLKGEGIYVDLTLGRGGTSEAILKKLSQGHLYCFDLDEEAIKESRERLAKISDNFTIIKGNFKDFKEKLLEIGVAKADGITADLGVSSPQFDEAYRGFSYREDAPLDMRMDQHSLLTAKAIVNTYPFEKLLRVFREYGEDPYSFQIAKKISRRREEKPIETTLELVDLIKESKPMKELAKKGHPAKQIFQALRIETNDELGNLKKVLEDFDSVLKKRGVIAIITFHSLEDRLVKERFKELTSVEGNRNGPDLLPNEIPTPKYELLTRRPLVASEAELAENNRSKSAKLRAIRKI